MFFSFVLHLNVNFYLGFLRNVEKGFVNFLIKQKHEK